MRFEIRTGGTILILVGLMGLSGAVFALGLVAGYEMARQNTPDISQVASVFPVPSAPPVAPSAAASPALPLAASPAGAAASPAPVAASTAGNLARPVLSSKAAARPVSTPNTVAARTTSEPRPAPAQRPAAAGEEAATEESAPAKVAPRAAASVASAAPAPESEARKKGYNIQIEAVMDHSGAADMIRKLRALGYRPYEVATEVNGQTWYRVRVGPYPSPEAARAAQDKLKEQYKAAYMSR